MRTFAIILSALVCAVALLSAKAHENRCPVVVEGLSNDPKTFQKNLPQDYCERFRKGGDLAGELRQANGSQIFTGVCSNTPQGEIPTVDNMPSALIIFPRNNKIKANTNFTVTVITKNVELGFFSDAATQYNVFPQQLNKDGIIRGHQHVSIQYLGKNWRNLEVPDASVFSFFKGLNDPSKNGKLSVVVANGLAKRGIYRCCTLTASFSHQCPVLPKAQRGPSDDCTTFEIC